MNKPDRAITGGMTLRYLFALATLAALALLNFYLLHKQITARQSLTEVVNISGRQRMLLQRTALLAERLVATSEAPRRQQLRDEILETLETLEQSHYQLIRSDSRLLDEPPEKVVAIYSEAPWMLDTEMRNYVAQLRSLAQAPDSELNSENSHLRYVRNAALSRKMTPALDAVVAAYQEQSDQRMQQLRQVALWTLASTIAVLILTGWFVFRPMVRRVKRDFDELTDLNESLERRVAERTAALRESESLYRSLIENLPLYVLRKDRQGRFTFVNGRLCALMGKPAGEILGRTDAEFYPHELAEKYRRDDLRVIETGQMLHSEEKHFTPAAKTMNVEVFKSPVRDAGGNIVETQTIFIDITERVETERRMLRAERLAAIGQMVAGVAHESRNALQQILACTQLLEWQLNGNEDALELTNDVMQAHDRLHRLFNDLRAFAAPSTLERRPVHLNEVVEQTWQAVIKVCDDQQKALCHVDGDGVDTRCAADPYQLEQVFRNIFENSLAACNGAAQIDVSLSAEQWHDEPAVCVSLRDNGPGLTDEQIERIFEPFFSTKTEGTGLGMAIVKRIVEAHGGEIQAGNGPAGGAQFIIRLPRGKS